MFQQAYIPGHQRRRSESKDLPEGKVPRHDGQYRTNRLVTNEAARRIASDFFIGEKPFRIFRVVSATRCAFQSLRPGGFKRLAHFERHDARKAIDFLLQNLGCAFDSTRPFGERSRSMYAKCLCSQLELLFQLLVTKW